MLLVKSYIIFKKKNRNSSYRPIKKAFETTTIESIAISRYPSYFKMTLCENLIAKNDVLGNFRKRERSCTCFWHVTSKASLCRLVAVIKKHPKDILAD